MNNNYTIACGITRHDIFLSNGNEMKNNPLCVTTMCINGVRDYMVDSIRDNAPVVYAWKRNDGKIVKLACVVEDSV